MRHIFPFLYEEGDSVEVCQYLTEYDSRLNIKQKNRWLRGIVVQRRRTCIGGVPTDDKIYMIQITGALPNIDIIRDKREDQMRLSTIGYMRRKKNAV